MAEDRKVYRSPARADQNMSRPSAPPPSARPPQPPRSGKPRRHRSRRRRSRLVLALCLLCILVVVLVSVVLTRCASGTSGPAQADFGTPAAAWQKN